MRLSIRLTLLYTSIVGGILFLFGTAVYVAVSVTLTQQTDARLQLTANQIIKQIKTPPKGRAYYPELDSFNDVYVQIWSKNGKELLSSSQNIPVYNQPLDKASLKVNRTQYTDIKTGDIPRRILTVPLVYRDTSRPVAILQIGTSLAAIQATQTTLLFVLFIGAIFSMGIAALAGGFSTHYSLKALQSATQTALQITHADDLSRRIPYNGPPTDEIGQLMTAFNQTLSRLENLFNTQRRFITDVGHELRTPLTVIKGNVDLMRRMACADVESMDSIENETNRLTRLVGDLLLLAQAESGKIPLANDLVEMDSLVLEALNQMRVLAKDRLKLKLGDFDQVLVCGDKDRLKQVLINLIGNAIKYTPDGGEVVVGLSKDDERARITVSDNGPGIPTEDLPHLFERFYRGEKSRTRTRDGKGFGLGLSIAYWIIHNHNGRLEVSSVEGKGTTFSIRLPLAKDKC